jgi:hypothetical protein
MADQCAHVSSIRRVTPSAPGCEECLAIGSPWVHLRLCRTCGHVGWKILRKLRRNLPETLSLDHFHAPRVPPHGGMDRSYVNGVGVLLRPPIS